jgi:hypothetical protein
MFRVTVRLKDDCPKGADQLAKALKAFYQQPLTQERFEQVRAQMKNCLQSQNEEHHFSLIEFYRDHFITHQQALDSEHPSLREKLLDALQLEDIQHFTRSLQGFSHVSIGSTEPVQNLSLNFGEPHGT